jgi:hypothetical protein
LASLAQPQQLKTDKETKMIYLIFVLSAFTRFLMNSHAPGFSPVFGALLFSGARLKKRDAIWFPVVVLAICDWILITRFYHMEIRWEHAITLLGCAAMAWIGGLLRQSFSATRFAGCSVAGSTAFFLISNFGVWIGWELYPHTWAGLLACYAAAVPYYRMSLLSTLVVGAVLFGGYEFLHKDRRTVPFLPQVPTLASFTPSNFHDVEH